MPQNAGFPEPKKPRNPDPNPVAGRIEAPAPEGYPAAPALAATPTISDLLRALRRRWMTAVALGGTLALTTAAAGWYLLTPKYTAFAQIRLSSTPPPVGLCTRDRAGAQPTFP